MMSSVWQVWQVWQVWSRMSWSRVQDDSRRGADDQGCHLIAKRRREGLMDSRYSLTQENWYPTREPRRRALRGRWAEIGGDAWTCVKSSAKSQRRASEGSKVQDVEGGRGVEIAGGDETRTR
jgi:hypothetical protein